MHFGAAIIISIIRRWTAANTEYRYREPITLPHHRAIAVFASDADSLKYFRASQPSRLCGACARMRSHESAPLCAHISTSLPPIWDREPKKLPLLCYCTLRHDADFATAPASRRTATFTPLIDDERWGFWLASATRYVQPIDRLL
jgi:hypothetical protein